MEKKTIGAFIAVLRKAAGMTQRELAERLNVSDKSVSRWERDECAPDLSLIPVIAEIFDITTDELLRGERKASVNEAEKITEEASPYIREKSTRQFQNLLRTQQMRLKERSLITLGVTFGGYLAAMICNFAFLKALLGFFLAMAFYVAAVILEICFLRRAAVAEDDAFDLGKWLTYQNQTIQIGTKYFFLILAMFGVTFPLLMTGSAYVGLEVVSYLIFALISTAAFSLLGFLVYALAVKPALIKKGTLFLTEAEKETQKRKHKLLKKTTITSSCIALVLMIAAGIIMESAPLFVEKIRFDDYDSFKEYMETKIIHQTYEANGYKIEYITLPITDAEKIPSSYITAEEEESYDVIQIQDKKGNILCEYQAKNQTVYRISYSFDTSEDGLPIYVITESAYREATLSAEAVSYLCCALAFLQALAAIVIYLIKARKYA